MSNSNSGGPRRILIIGNGAAGISAAKAARAQDPEAEIIMFGRDNRLPYYRLRLCDYIGRNVDYDELKVSNEDWFEKNRIRLELSSEVTALDVQSGKICADGKEYSYDSLVLATGSTPAMPPFKGKELAGIHTIWTVEDIDEINRSLNNAKKVVVIGGGLLGLEAAYKISDLGIDVSLIESMPRLLPKQLDEEGSEVFTCKVQSLGISVFCGKSVAGFDRDNSGHVTHVRMADDTLLEADAVIVSVGVTPNVAVFRDSGISMNRFIEVNEKMETNIRGIFAAGDVASIDGRWFGQWSVANKQGQVAGTNAAGGNAVFKTVDVPYILSTMGTRVVCSGDAGVILPDDPDAAYAVDQKTDKEKFTYSRLVFRNGTFVGYMLVGEPAKAYNKLQALINSNADAESINDILYS
ncbi:MAG TPA: FAD-dependent oxidoreductase [Candidatus Atribacteria bacterium]|mgnify:CR=1 FL=1|nr:FAD-dependent oxidoreductase [Candidatus Atribacteria bacterium]HPT78511.1 FAD-dependent oxidoreductase [Candidatus Atribacteria bacterium]